MRRFLALATIGGMILATHPARAEMPVDYLTQIKPLLTHKCYACHGVLKQEASLRLETRGLMSQGGDSGEIVVPGDATASLILERVTADKESRMPPAESGSPLTAAEVKLLKDWINQGATAPDEPVPQPPSEHWAFRRIERPSPPTSNSATKEIGATPNPVDAFLAALRDEHRLKTQSPAERSLLIRRLYLDLIGLPPTREQLHDNRPWEQIVDELIASPQYGERWGRHWMDVWRYSDWYGLGAQLRYSQKHIWRWRDWIIESLNSDKGYDRMIQEMLAGDELAPDDPDVIVGTGFLARNYYLFNRTTWLDSTIEHTSKAFMGLTLNCAKCHDHKYDPITHEDYYSFRAIFEPHQVRLDPVPGETDFDQDGLPRVFDDHLEARTSLHLRGDPQNPDEKTQIVPRVPELFISFQPPVEPVSLPATAFAPGIRDYVQKDRLDAAADAVTGAESSLQAAQVKLKESLENPREYVAASKVTNFEFHDDFEVANPQTWETVGDGWNYADGTLQQTQATRDVAYVRLKRSLPRDFEVTCHYTTTGGTQYKSVTFRFDESGDRKYANYVYTSAHVSGPKLQVAYTRSGASTYPADGRKARPVDVGTKYELRFAVRERLVNVWLDDEFVLAYELPDRQPDGHFALAGFDATVAYDDITIRNLPADVELTPARNSSPSPSSLETAVELAKAKLLAAQARQTSLVATVAADDVKYDLTAADAFPELATIAAQREVEAAIADAKVDLLAAGDNAAKIKVAEEKLKQAEERLAAVGTGKHEYTSLKASFKALETPEHNEVDYPPTYSDTSSGRRLMLARWLTSRDNPLTARVCVNHVWLRHFGKPIVESVDDFGLRAPEPLHHKLLDFLAVELIESGWSLKHLHRLIITSKAYQMSSSVAGADEATQATDPDNQHYWRMNARRMESQVVRDSLLQLADELDPTLGGPSVDVDNASRRRSLYFKHSPEDHNQFLSMFDDADMLQCYRRSESIVPQQALALANSTLSMTMGAKIADRISQSLSRDDDSDFIKASVETILGREATEDEQTACRTFCDELRQLLIADSTVAQDDVASLVRTRLVHSLLNHNDFISIR